MSTTDNKRKKRFAIGGAGVAALGVALGRYMKAPFKHHSAQAFKTNLNLKGKNPIWVGSDDAKRMKDLGLTYKGEASRLDYRVKPVKDLKKGETIQGGGFFGHRGDMQTNFPSNKDISKANFTGKVYNKPSITKNLEDHWTFYKNMKGKGMPKTELASNFKSVKDVESKLGKDYIVKQRVAWGNRGLVKGEDFRKNPKSYFNKNFIVQKKEKFKNEYRVLVAEGEPVYVLHRTKNQMNPIPTPRLRHEKDQVAAKAKSLVSNMKKHKKELHSLDMGVTEGGKIKMWENNAAQGANMFTSGTSGGWSGFEAKSRFHDFARGYKHPSYKKQFHGDVTQLVGLGAGGSVAATPHVFKEKKNARR